jgi:hypothetical protein
VTTTSNQPTPAQPYHDDLPAQVAGGILFVVMGPAAILTAWAGSHLRDLRSRIAMGLLGITGAAYLYFTRAWIVDRLRRTLDALHVALNLKSGHAPHWGLVVSTLLHHLEPVWIHGFAGTPLLALYLSLKRGAAEKPGEHDETKEQAKQWKREHRVARKAKRRVATPLRREGLFLGHPLGGDKLLPVHRGSAYLPWALAQRPIVNSGASGSGKTETNLRLAGSAARATDWAILYLDAKGDRENQQRFVDGMTDAGRNVACFPEERFDGWQGDTDEQTNRLLELIDYAQEGGGTYYRDLAVKLVRLACQAPPRPPASSRELLERLDIKTLAALYNRDGEADERIIAELEGLDTRRVAETRARYEAFFGTLRGALDGTFTWGDIDTAYFLLDGLRLKYEAGYLARFLVEDFTQWAAQRKARSQRVLLIVDEFSAIAQAAGALVDVVERTRGFGVTTVLAPQVAEGMGGPEASARILGSAGTILLHQMPSPDELVRLAGTRRVYEQSQQLDQDAFTGLGSARLQHEFRVNPNDVRRLRPGQCYAISGGRAQKLQIAPTQTITREEQQRRSPLHLGRRGLPRQYNKEAA